MALLRLKTILRTLRILPSPLSEETFGINSPVQEVFEAAKCHESLTENIPHVPAEFFDGQSTDDLDIEHRLLKIKFFRKEWCSSKPYGETEPVEMTPPVEANVSEPNGNNSAANDVPLYSTKEDAKDFNDWYLEQIGALPPPPSDVFDDKDKTVARGGVQKVFDLVVSPAASRTQLQAEYDSPEQEKNPDEEPIHMPVVSMDEDKVDNAMCLFNPYTSSLFEGGVQ
jgi:hypothetical protein